MSHTVLVCDDAIFMRTMISDILTQAGFEVVGEAESGVQAMIVRRTIAPPSLADDWRAIWDRLERAATADLSQESR